MRLGLNSTASKVSPLPLLVMPTGRREAPPDDRLRIVQCDPGEGLLPVEKLYFECPDRFPSSGASLRPRHRLAAATITILSIRVFAIGRPHLAIDASGKTRAVRIRRAGNKPNPTGIAEDKASMDMPMLLG